MSGVYSPDELDSSLTVKRDTPASRQSVWDVISDGWTYSQWVVGNSRMRAVDPNWPQPGSVIHHSIGVWPLLLNDTTVVESCTPLTELVLLANGRPFGRARVTLRLSDLDGGGCRIEMAEVPVSPPLSWLPTQAALASAFPRNRECTLRLAAMAERRTSDDT
ncbi:MAG: SRPBCC family protein [Mycolicibacterium sp.]